MPDRDLTLVTTHDHADLDAAAGMLGALLLHGGAIASFPGARSAAVNRFLEEHPGLLPEVRARDVEIERVATLVLVDTQSPERIGRFRELAEATPGVSVTIYDHHPPQDALPGATRCLRPVGSVVTVLADLLRERAVPLRADQATLLLLGMCEDTGGWLHAGTRPADHRIAAWLLDQGADLATVARAMTRGLSPPQVDLLHALLHGARHHTIGGRDVVIATAEVEADVPEASLVVQACASTLDASRLVALVHMDERVVLVARSRAPDFRASELAEALGGGGHAWAASANLRGVTLREAHDAVLRHLGRGSAGPRAADLAPAALYTVDASASVAEAAGALNRYRVNVLPVLRRGTVVGALTRQVADSALEHGLGDRAVGDVAAGEVPIVAPDADLATVRRMLLQRGQRFVLVGDGPAEVRGIVTRTALLQHVHEADAAPVPSPLHAGELGESLAGALRRRLPPGALDLLRVVGEAAVEAGGAAFLVGGVVRDLLLGGETRDLDVVVEGDAIALASRLARERGGRARAHATFGTAVLELPEAPRLDLASARSESYPRPGALPQVVRGSLRQDLFRRDFTFNAMAIRLSPPGFGALVDPYGGRKDLRDGAIRVLHGLSFLEDPTRAFRAVRFAARLGFAIPPETTHLLRVARREGAIQALSPTRLRRELELLFSERRVVRIVRLLARHRLLEAIHPAIRPGRRAYTRLERAEEALSWWRLARGSRPAVRDWAVALAVLLDVLPAAERQGLVARLRPPAHARAVLQDGAEQARALAAHVGALRGAPASAIHAACRRAPVEVLLLAMAYAPREAVRRTLSRYLVELSQVRPDVRGEDLLRAGVPPGPAIARALEAALVAKLDGRAAGAREQLAVALAAAADTGTP